MRNWRIEIVIGVLAGLGLCGCESPMRTGATQPPLPTGRELAEAFALSTADVGSFPSNLVLSRDGRFAISTDQGSRQALTVVRTDDGAAVCSVPFARGKKGTPEASNGLYYGLAVGPDNTVYAAQGNQDAIAVLQVGGDGQLTAQRTIKTADGDFPAGLALDDRGVLYVSNNDPKHGEFGGAAGVTTYDAASGRPLGRATFDSTGAGTSNFPLAMAVIRDGSKLFVASQRDACVLVVDARKPDGPAVLGKVPTGAHPDALLLNRAQTRLFVANAHSDTVSVVDTGNHQVIATVLLRPQIAADLPGATPTGLALSPDEGTLYATLGDMNAVAVIDVNRTEQPTLLGYVPAGWYPMAAAATRDGKRLLVASAKGALTRNPNLPKEGKQQSPLNLLEGTVSIIEVPTKKRLAEATRRVLEHNHLTPRYLNAGNPLASIGREAGRIKHVIYIVKENRTYDQVLGDLPQGNGVAGLCIFGRDVTPNLHALAERFVLLDNFYDSGEVSGDGWTWSTQAHSSEYVQRNVPYSYSNRGRSYDYEGSVNDYPTGGLPAAGPDGKPLAGKALPAIPDVGEAPGGHLWDLARKHGRTLRNYGMFVTDGLTAKDGTVLVPDNYPAVTGLQPGGHDLAGVTDVNYRRFDLHFADSDASQIYYRKTNDARFLYGRRTFGKDEVSSRFAEWSREFQMMLQRDPSGASVPELMLLRFPNDHTTGASAAAHTPRSMVADNDYAVGQLVEAVSKSPIWRSTAIFIIEDDAQNGPDHVDAHRSICFVISPWIRQGSVDHTFHNTVSVIKTMELLLGLPPMCQYDATAAPILDWDTEARNDAAYEAILPEARWIGELNPTFPAKGGKPAATKPGDAPYPHATPNPAAAPAGPGSGADWPPAARRKWAAMAAECAQMDFTVADRAPADRLSEIIWKTVKGVDSPMPTSPRGPIGLVRNKKDDDD